ncbi:MAG: tetratricopeptide repeat protein [Magnetospirillum sp. WYHS-4]
MNGNPIDQGRALHRAGDLAGAAALYEEARRQDPGHPEPWHLLGVIALQKGDAAGAERLIREGMERGQATAAMLSNLGAALLAQGRKDEAEGVFVRATRLAPDDPAGWYNLGSLCQGQGRNAEAREAFERVVALRPDHSAALNNLGVMAREGNDFAAARTWLERAAAVPGGGALPFLNLGGLFKERGLAPAAEAAFAEAARRGASDAAAVQEATLLPALYDDLEDLQRWRARFEAGIANLESRPLTLRDPLREIGLCAFYLAYQGLDDRALQERLAAVYRRACPALSYTSPHRAERRRDGRLRIGLISKYWRNHTIGKLNRGLVERLDRNRFEVVLLAAPGPVDETGRQIRAVADRAVALPPDLWAAQRAVAAERLDLLYFTDIGMDPFTYFLAFGRYAPVQCVAWGHPVTTGLDTLDWFVIQKDMEDAGGEERYTERLLRLNEIPTFYRRPPAPPRRDRAHFGLAETGTLYLCPQSLFKLTPAFDPVFRAVLDGDPTGRLVLIDTMSIAEHRDALDRRFRRHLGEAASRVHFLPRQTEEDFLALTALADVILDPFPFGGGNTSLEALSAGTPIVTRRTGMLRGDPTTAMLLRLEVPELAAADEAGYVATALRLGREPDFRQAMRDRIAAKAGILYENQTYIDEISAFFERAVALSS